MKMRMMAVERGRVDPIRPIPTASPKTETKNRNRPGWGDHHAA
jgi:hypothetical protein